MCIFSKGNNYIVSVRIEIMFLDLLSFTLSLSRIYFRPMAYVILNLLGQYDPNRYADLIISLLLLLFKLLRMQNGLNSFITPLLMKH